MANTISELSQDDMVRLAYERRMKKSEIKILETDTKYAVCLIKLHPAVVPANYLSIAFDIKQVTGVEDIDLIIDFQTRETLPVPNDPINKETKIQLEVMADLNLREVNK